MVKHGAAVDIRNKVELCGIYFVAWTEHMHIRGGTERVLSRERMISEVFILRSGDTALHMAAMEGKVEAVKALVDSGAAVDIKNKV